MRKTIYLIGILCSLMGCAEYDASNASDSQKVPIFVGSEYPTTTVITRASIDGGFVAGDETGIFVVDYDEDDQPGTMAVQGNRASNIRFTLLDDGSWTAPVQLYWDTNGKAADFYGYYPFDGNLSSVTAYRFSVESNQDTEATSSRLAGYTASDLLWAKKEHISPTIETITLQYHHLMAGVIIHLERGSGFTAEEWAELEKSLFIRNTVLDGTVDLSTGNVSVNSSPTPQTIRPLSYNGNYRAIVFPQTVAAEKELLQVLIDGQAYSLKKTEAMNFQSGKMHQFTITVNRSPGHRGGLSYRVPCKRMCGQGCLLRSGSCGSHPEPRLEAYRCHPDQGQEERRLLCSKSRQCRCIRKLLHKVRRRLQIRTWSRGRNLHLQIPCKRSCRP